MREVTVEWTTLHWYIFTLVNSVSFNFFFKYHYEVSFKNICHSYSYWSPDCPTVCQLALLRFGCSVLLTWSPNSWLVSLLPSIISYSKLSLYIVCLKHGASHFTWPWFVLVRKAFHDHNLSIRHGLQRHMS